MTLGLEAVREAVLDCLEMGDPLMVADLTGVIILFLPETSFDTSLFKVIPGSLLTLSEVLIGISSRN